MCQSMLEVSTYCIEDCLKIHVLFMSYSLAQLMSVFLFPQFLMDPFHNFSFDLIVDCLMSVMLMIKIIKQQFLRQM